MTLHDAASSQAPLLVFAQSKRGDRVPVEVSAAPVRNAAGDVVGGIELFRDMTASVREVWRAQRIQDLRWTARGRRTNGCGFGGSWNVREDWPAAEGHAVPEDGIALGAII